MSNKQECSFCHATESMENPLIAGEGGIYLFKLCYLRLQDPFW